MTQNCDLPHDKIERGCRTAVVVVTDEKFIQFSRFRQRTLSMETSWSSVRRQGERFVIKFELEGEQILRHRGTLSGEPMPKQAISTSKAL